MEAVDKACGRELLYEIPTIRPAFVRDNYRARTRPVGILPWNMSIKLLGLPTYRSVMRTDLTLIFDAILFDRSLYNPLFNFLSTLYLLLPAARRTGKKMAFYNVGAGPVTTGAGRAMLRKIADMMDFITVRDQASLRILREIGVANQRVAVTADAALNGRTSDEKSVNGIFRKLGLEPNEDILAINVNAYIGTWSGTGKKTLGKEEFLNTYSAAMNKVIAKLDVPVLVVATQHLDVAISRELIRRLGSNRKIAFISNVDHSHYDIKGVLGKTSLLVAMRLHSMILASSCRTPIAGLAYQPKIHHYFELLGLRTFAMGFEEFSEEHLVRHVLRAWDKRAEMREELTEKMPKLQAKAEQASELVACMDRGDDLDDAYRRLFQPQPI